MTLARIVDCERAMTNNNNSPLSVSVLASADLISADVRDARTHSVELFADLAEHQRDQLGVDAWRIGLHAIANAHAQAQEAKLKDIGGSITAEIDRHLSAHVEEQQRTIASVLAKFFDPKDGQVTQRLASFVADQGDLARLLEKFLAPQSSVLAQTLARQVGESSPLFKKLSPTETEGVVKVLEAQLRTVMSDGRAELVRALDPLEKDGAVGRFLTSLREELKGADEDRAKQLAAALAALDANDEKSLISRLASDTAKARQMVLKAVNPEIEGSPMAILKTTLTTLLKDQAAATTVSLERQAARQTSFEKEVREVLTRIETKRTQDQKSARGGYAFETAALDFIDAALRGAPCIFDVTTNTVGQVDRCKKGDAVARFTAESAFAGSAVVFEMKRDAGYSAQRALAEMDDARRNRDAQVGVFVMAESHASDTFPRFARHGSNVLVVWNEQDAATDPRLHAAIVLGLALVSRTKKVGDDSGPGPDHDVWPYTAAMLVASPERVALLRRDRVPGNRATEQGSDIAFPQDVHVEQQREDARRAGPELRRPMLEKHARQHQRVGVATGAAREAQAVEHGRRRTDRTELREHRACERRSACDSGRQCKPA